MFRYGRRNGYWAILLAVLCVVPLIETIVVFPHLSETVVIGYNASEGAVRESSRWYLAFLPVLACALGVASLITGFRRAADADSPQMAAYVFRRYVFNGLCTVVLFNVLNIYMLAVAVTGNVTVFF